MPHDFAINAKYVIARKKRVSNLFLHDYGFVRSTFLPKLSAPQLFVQGDIWAESRLMGFLWHYYACMEGAVYDVTDWAACQAGNLKHLRANTHSVQYRIVLGQRLPSQTSSSGKKRQQIDPNTRYASL